MKFGQYISQFLKRKNTSLSLEEKKFKQQIGNLLGYNINEASFFIEAFTLKPALRAEKRNYNYERQEFLGDAILDSIISSHIFTQYPEANEGFLTQMKSKVVNRKNLNKLGQELELTKFIQNRHEVSVLSENIHGNILEALIGAIYLDVDYMKCRSIVLSKLLTKERIARLENKIISYKGNLLEWAQKQKISLKLETSQQTHVDKNIYFRCEIFLDEKQIANASDTSKKKAEEKACQRAYYGLEKKR